MTGQTLNSELVHISGCDEIPAARGRFCEIITAFNCLTQAPDGGHLTAADRNEWPQYEDQQ